MKPIYSVKGKWLIEPTGIHEIGIDGMVHVSNAALDMSFVLPKGVTFNDFMIEYTECPADVFAVEFLQEADNPND